VAVGEIGIITGSRDTTIKIWADDEPSSCSLLHTLVSKGAELEGRLQCSGVKCLAEQKASGAGGGGGFAAAIDCC
jgi:hypothetical protein